jgi:hypothetical protein
MSKRLRRTSVRRDRCSECGVSDLVLLAIVLPIIMLLFAAIADLARAPLALERGRMALEGGAYPSEAELSAEAIVAESLTPAVNLLCEGADCSGSVSLADPNVLHATSKKKIAESACRISALRFASSSSLDPSDLFSRASFSTAFGWIDYKASSGTLVYDAAASSSDSCGGGTKGWVPFSDSMLDGTSFDSEAEGFRGRYPVDAIPWCARDRGVKRYRTKALP